MFVQIKNKGFTLIELLVVISIIGVLISFGAVRYQTSEKQARDTKRRSDLNQYRIALENYSTANNSLYPAGDEEGEVDTLCTNLGSFISACLHDPRRPPDYLYFSTTDGSDYVLGATLETGGFWEICSNGKLGKVDIIPADTVCDL